jgi:competence protein CoiA
MLIGLLGAERIDAARAMRGQDYHCPQCNSLLILKKGRKVIDHFAHKPPTDCSWAKGETQAHLEAKTLIAEALKARGLTAEVEFVLSTLSGDRRADVMVWSPKGQQIAFELQQTNIAIQEIEHRAASYAKANIAQIWIPFLPASVWKDGKAAPGGWFIPRYAPRPFERWIHGLNGTEGMWMYDPINGEFWLGQMRGHQIYVEETSRYEKGVGEVSGGGYHRWSKRYKELTLKGPHKIEALKIKHKTRNAQRAEGYHWPAGMIAHLVAEG